MSRKQSYRSEFRVPGMDCPSEEQMIRLRLSDITVHSLVFDLPGRRLVVSHEGESADVLERLVPLGYGAELVDSIRLEDQEMFVQDETAQAKTLWILLAINAVMFVVELIAGWLGQSAGLMADGIDMFADAAVYGVALYAVNKAPKFKQSAATLAGLLQLLLAVAAMSEVARRAWTGSYPDEMTMIGFSVLALIANVACLMLISKHRQGGVHMRASYIFSANDVLANVGVIVAALLVGWTGLPVFDWLIGAIISVIVLTGAIRILRLR